MKDFKSIIFTIGFCMIFNVLQSQDSTQKYWGINVSTGIYPSIRAAYFVNKSFMAYLPYYKYPSLITPSVTYTCGKHTFSLGPRILAPNKWEQQYSGQFTYDYIKVRKNKKVNYTFGMDNIYTYAFIDRTDINKFNPLYKSFTHQILLNGTVGLRKDLKDNFYFNASTGIGIALEKYSVKYTELTTYNRTGRFFDKPALNTLLKVGFGYNFLGKN